VFEGETRTYQLYVPDSYDGTRPVPVVFDFHGNGSNAVQQMIYGNFEPEADQNGFVIVAPDGQGADRHFNLTGEPGLQNDVTMVGALLDHIEAELCVDTRRVYATGMSDGGAMASVLACLAPNRFAAFGAVAVVVYVKGCAGTYPVAILAFKGTADPIVPYNGGKITCCGGQSLPGAPTAMADWEAHDGCSPAATDKQLSSQVDERTWSGCKGGDVVYYIIDGGGHTWPGSIPIAAFGLTTQQINASRTIWAFFEAHPQA
jgi:polyhydroxybutyrate depolymerase